MKYSKICKEILNFFKNILRLIIVHNFKDFTIKFFFQIKNFILNILKYLIINYNEQKIF